MNGGEGLKRRGEGGGEEGEGEGEKVHTIKVTWRVPDSSWGIV